MNVVWLLHSVIR